MVNTKVVLLEEVGKPVPADIIKDTIDDMARHGWSITHISTGGAGGNTRLRCWVYLIFGLQP
jgi:hypothetical protein